MRQANASPVIDPVTAVLAQLQPFKEIEAVYLFGSRARGDHTDRSDVDIAVSAPGVDIIGWSDIAAAVDEADTLRRIDLVRWEDADDDLKACILREGRRLL